MSLDPEMEYVPPKKISLWGPGLIPKKNSKHPKSKYETL